MTGSLTESVVEDACLGWLGELGYGVANGLDIGPDGCTPERNNYEEVFLLDRFRAAIRRLNPALTEELCAEVIAKVLRVESPSLVEENRRLYRYLIEGVPIEVARADGTISGEQARLVDFEYPEANDWLAVNQFTVIENQANRRPDIVLFMNGLPFGVIELKKPGDETSPAATVAWMMARSVFGETTIRPPAFFTRSTSAESRTVPAPTRAS